MSGAEAVLFDFDGVILESAEIKTRAFADLYADHPELVERIVAHHLEHVGLSRYAKFEWISRNLLGRELSAEESRRLDRQFTMEAGGGYSRLGLLRGHGGLGVRCGGPSPGLRAGA